MTRFALPVIVLAVLALSPPEVNAQRRRPPPTSGEPAAPRLADLPTVAAQLDSPDIDRVREAIDLLSVIDHPDVVPHLVRLLRSGRPDVITDRVLTALQGLASPASIEVLTEMIRHRRAPVRRRAYLALAAIDDRRVPTLLEQGLRDSDRNVRSTAARALGDIGARGSVDTLLVAFDRGVVDAAGSIGKLGDRAAIERFTEHLGRVPLSVMLTGYGEVVRRDDVADAVKIDIIGRLGEISGPMVRVFLQRYLDTLPEPRRRGATDRVRQVVLDTLRRIPGPGQAGATEGAE